MTFEQIWEQMSKKNPALLGDGATVTITAEQFRRALLQSYEQGRAQQSAVDAVFANKDTYRNSLFGKIFG